MTKQEINETIAKGIGLERCSCVNSLGCNGAEYVYCGHCGKRMFPADFFTWPGFGLMMEWWKKNGGPYRLNKFMSEVCVYDPQIWPEVAARDLAEYFTHSPATEGIKWEGM